MQDILNFLARNFLKMLKMFTPACFPRMQGEQVSYLLVLTRFNSLLPSVTAFASLTFDEPNKRMKEKNPAASNCVASWNICFED